MEAIKVILILPLIAAIFSLILGKLKGLREIVNMLFSGWILSILIQLYNKSSSITIPFFNSFGLNFSINNFSWFFLILINTVAFLTLLYFSSSENNRKNTAFFYFVFFLKVFGMNAVVMATDLLSFFISWEIMSIFTYFMIVYGGKKASMDAGRRYIVLSILGSMFFLIGMITIYNNTGTLDYMKLRVQLSFFSNSFLWWLVFSLGFSFILKSAALPLHFWLPDAYSKAETAFTTFLISISARIGIYGFIILFYIILGPNMDKMGYGHFFSFRYLMLWIAGLTMLVPNFLLFLEDDAKRMMSWSAIGQGGYMLAGLAIGTPLAVAGGLFHVVNHALYILLILMAIYAVEKKTGTTNLNELGGLIKKMPISFLGMLIAIIGLAGIPPMNGFVSKWMIYKSLISEKYPIIALMAFLGTIGTILGVYKMIHNIYLGQLREEHENIKMSPSLMQIPMIVLMIFVWGLGVFPGIAFKPIVDVQRFLGLPLLKYNLGGIPFEHLNMIDINNAMLLALVIAFIFFLLGGKRIHVSQYNNYAAGHFLDKNIPFNYNYNFYPSMERVIKPFNLRLINYLVRDIEDWFKILSGIIRHFYSGHLNWYVLSIFACLVILLIGGML